MTPLITLLVDTSRTKFNAKIPNQLNKILLKYKQKVYAIVYCNRIGPEDIYSKLKKVSGIQVFNIVTDLTTRKKQNLTELWQNCLQLPRDPSLVMKTFTILWRYGNDLKDNFPMKKKTSNPGKRKRQTNRNRKIAE